LAQQINIQVTIGGEEVSPVAGVTLSQDIYRHHAFEVLLPMDAFENSAQSIMQQVKNYAGKNILIRFGPHDFAANEPDHQFMGLVTHVGFSRSDNGTRTVSVRGSSPTILMDGKPQCRSHTEKTLAAIADCTLEKIPRTLESTVQPNHAAPIPYVVQYHETNYAFLQRLAARYGEWCFYDGAKLVFGKLPRTGAIELPFGHDLSDLDFSLQLLPVNGKAIAYNYLDNEAYESTVDPGAVSGLDPYGQFALQQSARVYAQEPLAAPTPRFAARQDLDGLLEQQTTAAARDLVHATGSSDNPYLRVGSTVNITGESVSEQDYGRFIITSVVHHVSGTLSYQNSFTAIPADSQAPPAPPVQEPMGNHQPAVVTDNADPEQLGRVKVKFYWQHGGETTPWVRTANHLAGGGGKVHGFYFVPEIDDEVMVGFEDNNPDKPFVVGSLYHKNSAPAEWSDNQNQTKAIRTRSGNQIYLFDKDGKEEIRILNKDFDNPVNLLSLTLEGDGKITIQTKGQLVMKANSIDMRADEGIRITSGKATEMQAQRLSVKADETIKMQSGQGTEVKAMEMKVSADSAIEMKSQQFTMESTTANLKASAQLSLEGAQSAIKAQMLQIDGGAQASVKAGIIMLN